jgi:hypothetical protein
VHIQLKDFFQKVWRHNPFFSSLAAWAGRLLDCSSLYALQAQQILRA